MPWLVIMLPSYSICIVYKVIHLTLKRLTLMVFDNTGNMPHHLMAYCLFF